MTLDEFLRSVSEKGPEASLSEPLRALWFDRKGDWDRAHQIAQGIPSPEGSWVHAYLHREEGDLWNARYWYQQAGRPESEGDLEAEWREIAEALLAQ
jgi:hypothetical protein